MAEGDGWLRALEGLDPPIILDRRRFLDSKSSTRFGTSPKFPDSTKYKRAGFGRFDIVNYVVLVFHNISSQDSAHALFE